MPHRFKDSKKVVYAIDYGTSNSLLAAIDEKGQKLVLPLDDEAIDPTILRSVLYFPHQDLCYFGERAVKEYNDQEAEGRLIRSIKKFLPSTSYVGSFIEDRVVRLETLVGLFLMEMRKRANTLIGHEVESVVLGRPARYSLTLENDKMAEYRMEKAAQFAGFKNVKFLQEPVAAAYDLKRSIQEELTVLVVDLGGGTSDFSVVRFTDKDFDNRRDLLGLGGVSLAGDAFDGAFMKKEISPYFGSEVTYKVPLGRNIMKMPTVLAENLSSPADIVQLRTSQIMDFFKKAQQWSHKESDRIALERLFTLVEDNLGFKIFEKVSQCKVELSAVEENQTAWFDFPYPSIDVKFPVRREEYESATNTILDKVIQELERTLKEAGVTKGSIDYVYCTGGTSKLFSVRKKIGELFPPEKVASSNFFHSIIDGLVQQAHKEFF